MRRFHAASLTMLLTALLGALATVEAQGQPGGAPGKSAEQPPDARSTGQRLQRALYAEEIRGDTRAALELYRGLRDAPDARIAARARLGIARCLQRQGRHHEALEGLRDVLRRHSDQLDIVQQALEMINAYKSEAERAITLSDDLRTLRSEKDRLEQQLAVEEREHKASAGQLRGQLEELRQRLRDAEDREKTRTADALRRLRTLASLESERQKIARELADSFFDAAAACSHEGRYAEALRYYYLARKNAPHDPRIDSRIQAILPLLGERERQQLADLRREIEREQQRLEQQLASARRRLRDLSALAERDPRAAIGPLRRFLTRELPESLAGSTVAVQARDHLLDCMGSCIRQGTPAPGPPQPLTGVGTPAAGDELIARYELPSVVREMPMPGGGLRSLRLDRQLRVVEAEPFVPPTAEARRRALHRALAAVVGLDQPRSPAFAHVAGSTLLAVGSAARHRSLAALIEQIHRGFGQLYDLKLQLIRVPQGAAAPWDGLLSDPVIAGDGMLQPLDGAGLRALDAKLGAQRGERVPPRALRQWGDEPARLTIAERDGFLVGYRTRLTGQGLATEPTAATLASGLELELRARRAPGGVRLALSYRARRVRRRMRPTMTQHGPIQLPASERQELAAEPLIPTDGGLLVFGLVDPVAPDAARPGQLALLIQPLPPTDGRADAPTRTLDLGPLADIPTVDVEDLSGRSPMPVRLELIREYLAAAAPRVEVTLTGRTLHASGSPAAIEAVEQRLRALRQHAADRVRVAVHLWSLPRQRVPGLASVAGRPIAAGRAAQLLGPGRTRRLIAALDGARDARRLPIAPGPYTARGTARVIASRVSYTRYLRQIGPPARYDRAADGQVVALTSLPGDLFDLRYQFVHIHEVRRVRRRDGEGFEPRRDLETDSANGMTLTIRAGQSALVTGLRDPADRDQRQLVLLIDRQPLDDTDGARSAR